jgi:hypothetical protein
VTLTASVQADAGSIANATATFKDLLSNQVLASGVKVSPVANATDATGTANAVVTLSSGKYGAQDYLIEVTVAGAYKNCQQILPTYPCGTGYGTATSADDSAYKAAHAAVTVIVPPATNTMQGGASIDKLLTAAGTYADASTVSYDVGLQYNNGGTNPQGQVELILQRTGGVYYIKSNSITSVAFSGTNNKDVTVYTKASIYKIDSSGVLTSIDGGVTLRMDAHDGGTTGDDTIGFTVLSSKNSALYYSNNWVYDSVTKAYKTMQQAVKPSATAVVIG